MTDNRVPPRPGFVPPSPMAEVIQELRQFRTAVEARLDHLESVSPPPMRQRMASQRDLDRLAGTVERVFEQVEEIATGRHNIPPPGYTPPVVPKPMPSERVKAIAAETAVALIGQDKLEKYEKAEGDVRSLKFGIYGAVIAGVILSALAFGWGRATAPVPELAPPPAVSH
jgi:hypothetical protein